jgi:hypothetical protein
MKSHHSVGNVVREMKPARRQIRLDNGATRIDAFAPASQCTLPFSENVFLDIGPPGPVALGLCSRAFPPRVAVVNQPHAAQCVDHIRSVAASEARHERTMIAIPDE